VGLVELLTEVIVQRGTLRSVQALWAAWVDPNARSTASEAIRKFMACLVSVYMDGWMRTPVELDKFRPRGSNHAAGRDLATRGDVFGSAKVAGSNIVELPHCGWA
jgi:hypothetical protein